MLGRRKCLLVPLLRSHVIALRVRDTMPTSPPMLQDSKKREIKSNCEKNTTSSQLVYLLHKRTCKITRSNLQLQPPKSSARSHGIAVCTVVSWTFLDQSSFPVAVCGGGVSAVVAVVRDDWPCCCFGGEETEGDEPEDQSEGIESNDSPVVVECWMDDNRDDVVDCDDECRNGLWRG